LWDNEGGAHLHLAKLPSVGKHAVSMLRCTREQVRVLNDPSESADHFCGNAPSDSN
jgi:hypothetical protein